MNIFIKTTLSFLLLFAFYATPVFAAEIRLNTNKLEVNSGEQFLVDIIIRSEESLNAIEGQLVFSADKLLVKDIRDGNSVINFWVEKPRETSGIILFSGITPGGFSGTNNRIFSVVFEAKNNGLASVALRDTKALLNDGLGSQAMLSTHDTTVFIKPGDNSAPKEKLTDTERPEDFMPIVVNDSAFFDGKNVLIFATQDKGSGIDHYEVREGFWSKFHIAESPYLLQNQKLDKKIFVKAVDKTGNERTKIFFSPNFRPWYKNYEILGILIVSLMLAGYIVKKRLWQKFIKSR